MAENNTSKVTLRSNPDTALTAFAKALQQGVKALVVPHNRELELCQRSNLVVVSYHAVSDEVEKFLTKLDEIPTIIIGRDSTVKIAEKGLIQRELVENIVMTPFDGSPTVKVSGQYRDIFGTIQIVIVAKEQVTAMEIAKSVLLFTVDFARTLVDSLFTDSNQSLFRAKNISKFELVDNKNKEFSPSIDKDLPLQVLACEYEFKESTFFLEGKEYKPYIGDGCDIKF